MIWNLPFFLLALWLFTFAARVALSDLIQHGRAPKHRGQSWDRPERISGRL